MVEPMLVSDHAHVCQTTEEYECSKLELVVYRSGLEASKQVACARAFEVDPGRLKDAPHKSGAVEAVWSSRAPAVARTKALIDGGHQQWLKLDESGARRTSRRRKVDRRFGFGFPGGLCFRDGCRCKDSDVVRGTRSFIRVAARDCYS